MVVRDTLFHTVRQLFPEAHKVSSGGRDHIHSVEQNIFHLPRVGPLGRQITSPPNECFWQKWCMSGSKHDTFFLYSYTAYPTSLVGQFINVCHSLPTNFEAPLDAWCTSLHHEISVCGRDEAYFWLAQPIVHMYHTILFGEETCKS